MTTAVIGVGSIGSAVARHLVRGGEPVVLAAREQAHADERAQELGDGARAASVAEAIADADVVVLAVWLDTMRELIPQHAELLDGTVVVDPSNPIGFDAGGQVVRTLPEDQSAAAVAAALLPAGAHYAKAFGSLGAPSLASAAGRTPDRAVLFYATDDGTAEEAVQRLITVAGFAPLAVGGVRDARRIEVPGGDLHENGGLGGRLLTLEEARAALAASGVPS